MGSKIFPRKYRDKPVKLFGLDRPAQPLPVAHHPCDGRFGEALRLTRGTVGALAQKCLTAAGIFNLIQEKLISDIKLLTSPLSNELFPHSNNLHHFHSSLLNLLPAQNHSIIYEHRLVIYNSGGHSVSFPISGLPGTRWRATTANTTTIT
jgi:hypothetical protein